MEAPTAGADDGPSSGRRVATAGAVNVQRKTWDREEFQRLADERAAREAAGEADADVKGPAPYRAAPAGLSGPAGSERAYLKAREFELHLDAKLGKRRLVTEATPEAQVGGYWCELCQCTLRDSSTWLDHINGKKHQRRLGFSMRVEPASSSSVRDRFAALKQQGAASSSSSSGAAGGKPAPPALDVEDRYALAAMDRPRIETAADVMAARKRRLDATGTGAAAADGGGDDDSALGGVVEAPAHGGAGSGAGGGNGAAKRRRADFTGGDVHPTYVLSQPAVPIAAAVAVAPIAATPFVAAALQPLAAGAGAPANAGAATDPLSTTAGADPGAGAGVLAEDEDDFEAKMGFTSFGGSKKR